MSLDLRIKHRFIIIIKILHFDKERSIVMILLSFYYCQSINSIFL